jgi:hypothetical protein
MPDTDHFLFADDFIIWEILKLFPNRVLMFTVRLVNSHLRRIVDVMMRKTPFYRTIHAIQKLLDVEPVNRHLGDPWMTNFLKLINFGLEERPFHGVQLSNQQIEAIDMMYHVPVSVLLKKINPKSVRPFVGKQYDVRDEEKQWHSVDFYPYGESKLLMNYCNWGTKFDRVYDAGVHLNVPGGR